MDAKKRRLIKWAIVLVVLIALGVWVASRWKVWFGNPPEEPYVAIQTPGRVMLTFGNEPDERFVSWQYDSVPTQGFVEIVKNGAADTLRKAATAELFK
ncbi:MAG: fibronectin type III domain-containing protein, partial [Paludibacteraceae bacterium]|nr:fibronectin type III domain-containing protein [Paludibacteraceae bacterium]